MEDLESAHTVIAGMVISDCILCMRDRVDSLISGDFAVLGWID